MKKFSNKKIISASKKCRTFRSFCKIVGYKRSNLGCYSISKVKRIITPEIYNEIAIGKRIKLPKRLWSIVNEGK